MFTVLFLNQKGGVGKTTLADELAFALARRGLSVAFVSTDPQGGAVHESCPDVSGAHFQVVDTAGTLSDQIAEWCRAADLILVPLLPSTRDVPPTLRTLELVASSGSSASVGLVVNQFNARGVLDRQLLEFLEGQDVPVVASVPRSVMLARAAAEGQSVAQFAPRNAVVSSLEQLTEFVVKESGR